MYVKKGEGSKKQRPRQDVTRSLLQDSFWANAESSRNRETLAQSLSDVAEKREKNHSLANKQPEPIPTITLIKGFVVGALALGGLASSLTAMILEVTPLVIIAGSVCIVTATTVAYKEYMLVIQPS